MTVSELGRNARFQETTSGEEADSRQDKRIARDSIVESERHCVQARPWGPRGRPRLLAIVSPTSARLARAPIEPGEAPAPKARIGTCSRV
jgi:hypothetical protein